MRVRSRPRRTAPRAKTIATKRITRHELRVGALMYPQTDVERPRTRAECPDTRPCPWVACRHHLYLDVNGETGSIKFNHPDIEPHELAHSCSLDEADAGVQTLEEIGERTNLTRERVRQLETYGLLKLKRALRGAD